MAHKTTPEENYSGLVEEGFEQWTIDWSEFYDFIAGHKGQKIDVTISADSAEQMQKEFDDYDTDIGSIFDYLNEQQLESKTLVLRLPFGFKSEHDGFQDYSIPDCIAKLYLPPTYYDDLELDDGNKDIFVVASNFTYKTGYHETDNKEYTDGKCGYNDDEGEPKFKTYQTSYTHFPAGKYVVTFDSMDEDLLGNGLYVFFEGCSKGEIASAMVNGEESDWTDKYFGTAADGASLKIRNVTTGQTWTIKCEGDCDGPEFYFDGVTPCLKLDCKSIEPEDYFTSEIKGWTDYIGNVNIDDDDGAVDFPNGFNFGDIKIESVRSYNAGFCIVRFRGIKNVQADPYSDEENGWYNIHIGGEEYEEDELEDLVDNDYEVIDDDDEDNSDDKPDEPPAPETPPSPDHAPQTPSAPEQSATDTTPPASSNPLADMNAALKASLEQSQAALKASLEESQAALKKSLDDALKGLK